MALDPPSRLAVAAAGCAAMALTGTSALAQPAAPLAPDAGALIIDQQRQDRRLPEPPAAAARPALPPVAATEAVPAPATPLRSIRLTGSDRLAAQAAEIGARLAGRPLDGATIKAAADAVSAAYAESGLALYMVAAPRQDFAQGVLVLHVVEGYLAEVTVGGDPRIAASPLVAAQVAALKVERPLTRATLERRLSLLRDIPGVTVQAQLQNTAAPGAVRMTLNLELDRVQPEISFNNQGTPRLGRVSAQAALTANSLMRPGDRARLTVAAPTEVERFQYVGLTYAAPVGTDGLTVQGSVTYLRTRPESPPIEGDATTVGVQLSYPVIRGYARNLSASAGLDGLNSDNAIYGQTFTSDHTRALRAGLAYSAVAPRRSLSAGVTGSLGLDVLGARTDGRITDAGFRKLNLQVMAAQALGPAVAVRLRGLAQASGKRLPAAEQLPLGGEAFGRAFYSGVITGDHGYAGSAELAWIPQHGPSALKGSEIFGFLDGGRAWTRARPPFVGRQALHLASVGGGVRLNLGGRTLIALQGAKAIDARYPGGNGSRPWRVLVSWRTLR